MTSGQRAAELAELRGAGWGITHGDLHGEAHAVCARRKPFYVLVQAPEMEDAEAAMLEAVWRLVGNPWGGGTPDPEPNPAAVRTRGTNRLYPGHGVPVEDGRP